MRWNAPTEVTPLSCASPIFWFEQREDRPELAALDAGELEGVLQPLMLLRGLPGPQCIVAQLIGRVGGGFGEREDRGADRGGDAGDLGRRGRQVGDIAGDTAA